MIETCPPTQSTYKISSTKEPAKYYVLNSKAESYTVMVYLQRTIKAIDFSISGFVL